MRVGVFTPLRSLPLTGGLDTKPYTEARHRTAAFLHQIVPGEQPAAAWWI